MRTRYALESFVDEKVALIAEQSSVLDVGSSVPFSKWLAPHKPLFADCIYRTFDNDPATGADVIGDIHAIPLPDGSVDAVICSSVLEHVRDPIRAMGGRYAVSSSQGGIAPVRAVDLPYHQGRNGYPDNWRIFDDTMPILLEGFATYETAKRGGYFLALSYFLPRQHTVRAVLDRVSWILDTALRTERRKTTAGYYAYAIK